jgi:hypothetical protein
MNEDSKLPLPSDAEFRAAAAEAKTLQFARRPATGATATAIESLHARMNEAAKSYEGGSLDDQRHAVFEAVLGVYEMLVEQGFSELTLAPLFRPIDALEAQFHRKPDLLFAQDRSKKGKGGRPIKGPDRHHRDGILAALAEFWMQNHDQAEKADIRLARAARRFSGGRWFGQVTKAQLNSAREIVSQEAASHPAVVTAEAMRKRLAQAAADYGGDKAITVTIRILNDASRAYGAGNWDVLDPG